MTLHDLTWPYIPLHDLTWPYMTLHTATLPYISLHDLTWPYMTLHCLTFPYITLHDLTWPEITLHLLTLQSIPCHAIALHTYMYNMYTCIYIYIYILFYLCVYKLNIDYMMKYDTVLHVFVSFQSFWDCNFSGCLGCPRRIQGSTTHFGWLWCLGHGAIAWMSRKSRTARSVSNGGPSLIEHVGIVMNLTLGEPQILAILWYFPVR
jgi:hypothetical protein